MGRHRRTLARSLRASPLQIFVKAQLPAALPFILTGAKVAITLSVIGAVIGEFVGSSEGLGFLLLTATSQLDTPLAFAALVWWMYHTIAFVPGGQPIGALERAADKALKAVIRWIRFGRRQVA